MISLIQRSDLFELSAYHCPSAKAPNETLYQQGEATLPSPKGCEGRARSGDRIVSIVEKTERPILC